MLLAPEQSTAGDLAIFESSAGEGMVMLLPTPATDVSIDLEYNPQSAEGGGFYGFSEVRIETTGDLVLTPAGFDCSAFACLYSPLPFVAGTSITLTAADDLNGEFDNGTDMIHFSISGTEGHVVLAGGEYIDATGDGATVGAVQQVDVRALVTVPEPGLAWALALGCVALAGFRRFTD